MVSLAIRRGAIGGSFHVGGQGILDLGGHLADWSVRKGAEGGNVVVSERVVDVGGGVCPESGNFLGAGKLPISRWGGIGSRFPVGVAEESRTEQWQERDGTGRG